MAFPADYTLLQKITIDNTKVSGGANLTDFPVLITEDHIVSNTWSSTDDGGGDVRFSSDDAGATQLPCEVVSYDNSGETCEIWVKRTLDHDDDTIIYLWGDNTTETQPARDNAYGSDNVWNSNYEAVYHLEEASSTRYDSTSNENNLTDNNTVDSSAGKIGTDADFGGTNQYLGVSDNNTLDFADAVLERADFTIQTFVNLDAKETNHAFVCKGDVLDDDAVNYLLDQSAFYGYKFVVSSSAGGSSKTPLSDSTDYSTGSWVLVHGTYKHSTTTMVLYTNGTQRATTSTITKPIASNSGDLRLGCYAGNTSYTLDGKLDETRILSATLSSDWIATEYANQNAPGTFATGEIIVSEILQDVIGLGIVAFPR